MHPELKIGDEGEWVEYAQRILGYLGYGYSAIDGHFGPKTQRAVEEFQESVGLSRDGQVGQETWGKLEAYSGTPMSVEPDGPKPGQDGQPAQGHGQDGQPAQGHGQDGQPAQGHGQDGQPADVQAADAAIPQDLGHADDSVLEEWLRAYLEGEHIVSTVVEGMGILAEVTEAAATAGSALGHYAAIIAECAEATSPLGWMIDLAVMGWDIAHSMNTGPRIQEAEGYAYGIVCALLGAADPHKDFVQVEFDTAEAISEAWHTGVQRGREHVSGDGRCWNAVMLALSAASHHYGEVGGAEHVLNVVFARVKDADDPTTSLSWPQPAAMDANAYANARPFG